MRTYCVDLSTVHTLHDLHLHLKEVFSLPEHYGMNMDALWDCLHGRFEEPVEIQVKGARQIPASLEEGAAILGELLADLEQEDAEVEIIYL